MGGDDEFCAICGLTPAVITSFEVEFFNAHRKWRSEDHDAKTVALARPSMEGGPPSWCPIDVAAYKGFHNNLAVIGHFNGKSPDDDDYDKHTDPADWPHLLKAKTVSLICKVTHREGGPLEQVYLSKKPGRPKKDKAFRVPGHEANTSNLDGAKDRGWPRTEGYAWEALFSGGALMVHVPCWELLQGVVQWRTRTVEPTPVMTPLRYWRTEYSAGLAKAKAKESQWSEFYGHRARQVQVQEPSPVRWRDFDIVEKFVWHGFCDAFIFLHEGNAHHEFQPHVAAAINDSIDGKEIDLAVREEVWQRLPAWIWQPPYLFEVEHGLTSEDEMSLPAPSSLSFGRLPTELWLAITSHLDLSDVLALAATSRAMHRLAAQPLDEAAKCKIDEKYPWMLPYTKREGDAWERRLLQAKEDQKLANPHFSWLAYLKKSINTSTGFARSRRRIWELAVQVVDMSLRIDAEGRHNLFRQ